MPILILNAKWTQSILAGIWTQLTGSLFQLRELFHYLQQHIVSVVKYNILLLEHCARLS